MRRRLDCTRVLERLEALYSQPVGEVAVAPFLRLLGSNAMQVKAGTARPGKVTTRSRKR
jgi:hypothetical protein